MKSCGLELHPEKTQSKRGVDFNSFSPALSGEAAKRIREHSAGFLRIRGGDNPLDVSGVHPETYPLVERMASALKTSWRSPRGKPPWSSACYALATQRNGSPECHGRCFFQVTDQGGSLSPWPSAFRCVARTHFSVDRLTADEQPPDVRMAHFWRVSRCRLGGAHRGDGLLRVSRGFHAS